MKINQHILKDLFFPILIFVCGKMSAQIASEEIPKADLHVHVSATSGFALDERYRKTAELSRQMGVVFGIAEEPGDGDLSRMDAMIETYRRAIEKYPLYLGLQVLRDGWTNHYSKEALAKVDYVMADAMIMPVNGKYVAIWKPEIKFNDPQDFMNRYIEYHLKVFQEPINIWCNATYLPAYFMESYNALWTDSRMKLLIDAAVKNGIAIEINSNYKLPSKKFILMAKAAGAKFSIGSNTHDKGVGDVAWSIGMAKECGLTKDDFFMPSRQLSIK